MISGNNPNYDGDYYYTCYVIVLQEHNNLKIINLKRGVGIDHCYKSKEARWKRYTCQHCYKK